MILYLAPSKAKKTISKSEINARRSPEWPK